MGHIVGAALEMAALIVSRSFGSASRAVRNYDGRRPPWQMVAASSVAAAVHVPTLVGFGFAFRAVLGVLADDMFFILGMFLVIPGMLLVAVGVSAVMAGVTIGVWLLVDRPGARWFAGFFALSGLMIASYATYMDTPVARVVGWSTGGLSLALLALVLIPRTERSRGPEMADLVPASELRPEPRPTLTQPGAERGRFVL